MRRNAVLLLTCLVLAAPAWANTRFGFGTIIAVDPEGKNAPAKGRAAFGVLFEFRNLSANQVLPVLWFGMQEKTRHGDRVYFLDGKPSTAAEAIVVGRAISMTDNDMAVFVSSRPGPHDPKAVGKADSAIYRFALGGAFQSTAAKVDKDQVGEMRPLTGTVELVLDCDVGVIRGATVVISALGGQCDFAADAGGLKFAGGAFSGTVAAMIVFPKEGGLRLKEGDKLAASYTLTAKSDEAGAVTGTFEGTCGATKVQGKVAGSRMGRSAMPASPRTWLQIDQLAEGHMGYVVVEFADGKAKPGGVFLFSKGHQIGTVGEQDVKLDGAAVKGTLKGAIDGKAVTVTLDGAVLGNRLIFGTYRMTRGEGTVEGRLRGGICATDGPQICGPSAEQKKTVQEMQAKLGGEKPKE